jgi:hypothetical protein
MLATVVIKEERGYGSQPWRNTDKLGVVDPISYGSQHLICDHVRSVALFECNRFDAERVMRVG